LLSIGILPVLAGCYGSFANSADVGDRDTAAVDARPDTPADAADTATDTGVPCTLLPTARENGAYVVTSLELVRPNVLGSVSPTLTARIDMDDISVVLATNLRRVGTGTFTLVVGPAIQWEYGDRPARFCTDDLCYWPPNVVSSFPSTIDCREFSTTTPGELTFSLYPPSHPAAATPLHVYGASITGRFDDGRERIVEGLLTGGVLEEETPMVFPAWDLSLDELLTAAGIPMDFHINRDGIPDGWQIELRFTAEWIAFER
jgi:hypothetical protein